MSLTFTLRKRTAFIVVVLLWFVPSCQTLFITVNARSTDCLFLVNTKQILFGKTIWLEQTSWSYKTPKRPNETPTSPKLNLFFLTEKVKNEVIWVFPIEVPWTSQKWLCCHLPGTHFRVRSALCSSWSEINPFSPIYPPSKRERKDQLKQKWKDVEIKCSSGRSRKVKQEKARGETQYKESPSSNVPQSSMQSGSLAGVYLLSPEYCVKLFCSPELYNGNLTKRSDLEVLEKKHRARKSKICCFHRSVTAFSTGKSLHWTLQSPGKRKLRYMKCREGIADSKVSGFDCIDWKCELTSVRSVEPDLASSCPFGKWFVKLINCSQRCQYCEAGWHKPWNGFTACRDVTQSLLCCWDSSSIGFYLSRSCMGGGGKLK